MQHTENVSNWYQRRVDDCQRQLATHHLQDTWLGRLRVGTFLPALGLAYYGSAHAAAGWPYYAVAALLVTAFVILVKVHERILQQAREMGLQLEMNQVQLARIDRRWSEVPVREVQLPPQHSPLASDLDLFGQASLFQLISQAHTPFGQLVLRDWLLAPASCQQIKERQAAVSFLAPATDIRQQVDLRGRLLGASRQATLSFVEWAEAAPWLKSRRWLTWLTQLLTAAVLVTLIGFAFDASAALLVLTAILCVNLVLNLFFAEKMHAILARVTSRSHSLADYHPLLETVADLPAEIAFFANLHARMGATPRESIALLSRLMGIVRVANLRRDGLLGIPYYLSQLFFLTDFHVLWLMERWQFRHGSGVRGWLEAVGQLEAISSLALVAHDHPHWTMPSVENRPEKIIAAKQLGHPLLAEAVRMNNDVEVGPAGTFLLVTGSNMSGKSTLLRAVGVNVCLAQAGAPVCAQEFRLPPLELATSMRIRDSLADGVSFFMAELRRLKEIVDQSHQCRQRGERTLLYLLDEVLQGTNSAERHIAVMRVIRHLVEHGAIGIISTHDLELARSPELNQACQAVHFRETITDVDGRQQMTFDYRLRPGLAPTTNALKLLEFVGLDP